MNFTIYIEDSIGKAVTQMAHGLGKTRNAIVREALEEWCTRHKSSQWEPGFFDFKPVKDCPDFSEYRSEFQTHTEDPLQ